MTMTELIGRLERQGWRFHLEGANFTTRPPQPRPADAADLLLELGRRKVEAAGFLRARQEAYGAMQTFHLLEVPIFAATPLPDSRLFAFPMPSARVEAKPVRKSH